MRISNITINGYRNFEQFNMDLKQFTLVIGENNIGKTNLLNALGLIFGQEISIHRKRILTSEDFNYKMLTNYKEEVFKLLEQGKNDPKDFEDIKPPEVKIEVTLTNFNEDQEAVVADWFTNRELTEAKITYCFAPNIALFDEKSKWFNELKANYEDGHIEKLENIEIPISYYRYKIYGGDNSTKQIDYYFLNMFKMEFLDALRDAQRELVSQNDYRLLNRILKNKADSGNVFKELQEDLTKLNEKIKIDKDVQGLRDELFKLLKEISLSGEKEKVNFRFSALESSDLFKRLSLFYGDDQLNIDKNGLGKNNLLYIALVLSHLENLEKENQKIFYRLIAIEEPEAHLHPHLQKYLSTQLDKQICENFQSGNCKHGVDCKQKCKDKQIIVTSHSTHITSHLPLENTAILFDDCGDVKAHYILKGFDYKAESQKHVKYLKKYLTATNSTMFFARKIIMVEGISEQILIPKFYEIHTDRTLEKDGITLINVNGVAFKHFLEIIKHGYYKKCLVITDSDTNTKMENRAANLEEDYKQLNELISIEKTQESTFEKDIIKDNLNVIRKVLAETRKFKIKKLLKLIKNEQREMTIEEGFDLIKNHKSEFAFNLSDYVSGDFNVPQYIKAGFEFLKD